MPIPEFLPSIRESETITCQRCHTRQYPRNGTCIRCHTALSLHYVSFQIDSLLVPGSEDDKMHLARWIGILLGRASGVRSSTSGRSERAGTARRPAYSCPFVRDC